MARQTSGNAVIECMNGIAINSRIRLKYTYNNEWGKTSHFRQAGMQQQQQRWVRNYTTQERECVAERRVLLAWIEKQLLLLSGLLLLLYSSTLSRSTTRRKKTGTMVVVAIKMRLSDNVNLRDNHQ